MRFLYPQYFKLFFLLLILLPFWLYHVRTKQKTRSSLGSSAPLRQISRVSSLWREAGRYCLLNLTLAALVLALAHPQMVREKRVPMPRKMDVVFLLDNSQSMRAQDVHPSRLERALEVIATFARKKPRYDRVGLVSFSSGSLILSYLTEDSNNILYYLDYLREDSAPNFGTNIGRALKNGLGIFAKELEVNPAAANHKRVFVLLSDGEDHGQEVQAAIKEVKQIGIKVHTIGIGSREGAPIPITWNGERLQYLEDQQGNRIITRLDERSLSWIAEETGGASYHTFTGRELEASFADIVLKEREIEGFKKIIEYQDVYREFLWAALGIFLTAVLV